MNQVRIENGLHDRPVVYKVWGAPPWGGGRKRCETILFTKKSTIGKILVLLDVFFK
jgi:hypothetical protein